MSFGLPFCYFNQQERLTAIRGPTQWSAHSRGCGPLDLDSHDLMDNKPKARVLCLKHEPSSPELSGLFVLLTVEAFPVAGGLLRG